MKTKVKNFIKLLKQNPPFVYHKETEDVITIEHKIGNYRLEFRLEYSTKITNYHSADNSNPEECEFEFENQDINEIELSFNSESIEMTVEEVDKIYQVLKNQLSI